MVGCCFFCLFWFVFVFCSEDAHILNKQSDQLLMVRNNLFPTCFETEMKGVLGKKKQLLSNGID